jgi:hypothetical protein
MIKILLFLSAASLLNAWGGNNREAGLDNREYSHYDIQLKIIPDKQFIKVSGGLKFLVMEDGLDELTFNLHKKMEIGDFSINGDHSCRLDTGETNVRWLPDAMTIRYPAGKRFHKGEILNIEFSYQGKITQWPSWSANVIGADWVEMGLYFPWYPSVYGLFTYSVSVEIEPDYKVFALGQSTEKGNKKVFKTEFPVDDFIICAAKELTIRETKLLNRSFQIVNCTLSEATVDSIQADIEDCYRLFSSWFGEIQVHDMCLVASKRAHGGGYSRKGGLFLGGLSDSNYVSERMDHVLYLGHEIAHFWWNGAAGDWEDWLNESYAEYSALLLIREFRSKEEFNSRLNVKRDEGKNTPPIWGMSRSDPSAEQVLYGKGAVLLSELEERIGHDRFLKLCQARINMKANNTPDLLTLISDIGGKETADWFEQSLKTR